VLAVGPGLSVASSGPSPTPPDRGEDHAEGAAAAEPETAKNLPKNLAIGTEDESNWYVFSYTGGKWLRQKKLTISDGLQPAILRTLTKDGHDASRKDLARIWKDVRGRQDPNTWQCIRSEVSKLQKAIQKAARVDGVKVFQFDKRARAYHSSLPFCHANLTDSRSAGGVSSWSLEIKGQPAELELRGVE
jgi:hypothetical protein